MRARQLDPHPPLLAVRQQGKGGALASKRASELKTYLSGHATQQSKSHYPSRTTCPSAIITPAVDGPPQRAIALAISSDNTLSGSCPPPSRRPREIGAVAIVVPADRRALPAPLRSPPFRWSHRHPTMPPPPLAGVRRPCSAACRARSPVSSFAAERFSVPRARACLAADRPAAAQMRRACDCRSWFLALPRARASSLSNWRLLSRALAPARLAGPSFRPSTPVMRQ